MAPREYCVWNSAEEKALLTGVQRHGLGAWEIIRSDPEFKSTLRCVAVCLGSPVRTRSVLAGLKVYRTVAGVAQSLQCSKLS